MWGGFEGEDTRLDQYALIVITGQASEGREGDAQWGFRFLFAASFLNACRSTPTSAHAAITSNGFGSVRYETLAYSRAVLYICVKTTNEQTTRRYLASVSY